MGGGFRQVGHCIQYKARLGALSLTLESNCGGGRVGLRLDQRAADEAHAEAQRDHQDDGDERGQDAGSDQHEHDGNQHEGDDGDNLVDLLGGHWDLQSLLCFIAVLICCTRTDIWKC